ncbi:hypothetical protein IAU60_006004 [Kwoniella sp. DSM 27419]
MFAGTPGRVAGSYDGLIQAPNVTVAFTLDAGGSTGLSALQPSHLLPLVLTLGLGLIPLALLHFRSYLAASRRPSRDALPSYLVPAVTSHGRHLPLTTRNAFSYSLLYLAVDVDSLVNGHLDLPFRLVKYGGRPRTKVIGLRSKWYLGHGENDLRQKLETLLMANGFRLDEIGRAWFLTLPSLLGFEGTNPLTTWYVYRKRADGSRGDLLCYLLEVHNSFEESHCYILRPESKYAHEPARGYDHAFTFPRSFHVSPFNSRDSYYRADLVDPFPPSFDGRTMTPSFKTHLRVLTPEQKVKFNAVLTSGPSPPILLDPWKIPAICSALGKWPFTLMLVQVRTYYQAYRLHYLKRLALYKRPETRTTGDEGLYNPPEKDVEGVGVGLQRNKVGWVETNAKSLVWRWAEVKAEESGVDFEVIYRHTGEVRTTVPVGSDESNRDKVVIVTSDSHFYTHLVLAPSPQHMLIIAPEGLTSISSSTLFIDFFTPLKTARPDRYSRFAETWRVKYYSNLYANSTYPPLPSLPPLSSYPHWTAGAVLTPSDRLLATRVTFWWVFAEFAEEKVFDWLAARFVPGQEPWKVWERGMKRVWGVDTTRGESAGSVLLDERRLEIIAS